MIKRNITIKIYVHISEKSMKSELQSAKRKSRIKSSLVMLLNCWKNPSLRLIQHLRDIKNRILSTKKSVLRLLLEYKKKRLMSLKNKEMPLTKSRISQLISRCSILKNARLK